MARDVDIVNPAAPDPEEIIEDPALMWWLISLAQRDRETYRRVRALAWGLVVKRSVYSAIPKNLS